MRISGPPKILPSHNCSLSPSMKVFASPLYDFQRLTQTPRKADPCDLNSPFSRRAFCAPKEAAEIHSASPPEHWKSTGPTEPALAYRKLGGRVVCAIERSR